MLMGLTPNLAARKELVRLLQISQRLKHLKMVLLSPLGSQKSKWALRYKLFLDSFFVDYSTFSSIMFKLIDLLLIYLQGCLLYNEYIVYNVEQIRMRYVVQVNFDFKRKP